MKILAFIIFLLSSYLYSANIVEKVKNPKLQVTFVDVGQGDGALIRNLINGKTIVVDTGLRNGKIEKYLRSQNIKDIDLLILTHPHSDHIGYAKKLILNFNVKRILDSAFPHPSKVYERVLKAIKKKNIPYIKALKGQNINIGNQMRLRVLAPNPVFFEGTRSDANTNSIVFILEFKNAKYYFAADSEAETEDEILKNYKPKELKVDVLKLAHHGSAHATSESFLNATRPKVAIVSAGKGNSYGHPSDKVLRQVKERKIKLYSTITDGNIESYSDGENIAFKTIATNYSDEISKAELYTIAHNDTDNFTDMQKNGVPVLFKNKKAIISENHFYSTKNSKIFFAPYCKIFTKIKEKQLIEFSSYELAINSNRTFDKNCELKKEETGKININTASLNELRNLPGIGTSTSQKILNYRNSHGNFKAISHIKRVKGIGKGKFRKMQDFITVGHNTYKKIKSKKIVHKNNIPKQSTKKEENKQKQNTNQSNKININVASANQLKKLPGIGSSTAQKIINYRNSHGKFKHISHIKRIKGIGKGKYKKIKDLITI